MNRDVVTFHDSKCIVVLALEGYYSNSITFNEYEGSGQEDSVRVPVGGRVVEDLEFRENNSGSYRYYNDHSCIEFKYCGKHSRYEGTYSSVSKGMVNIHECAAGKVCGDIHLTNANHCIIL